MKRSSQPLRFAIVLIIVIAALCAVLAACGDEQGGQPASPHIPSVQTDIVLGPLCPGNPFDSVGVRHNRILHETFRLLATRCDSAAQFVRLLPQALGDVLSVYGAGVPALIDSGRRTAMSLTLATAADFIPASLALEEQLALRGAIDAVTGNCTADGQKRALCDLESDMLNRGWPLADGTGSVALAAVSIAKHSCYFWNWVFEDASLDKRRNVTEKLATDRIIVADFITFVAVMKSSFNPAQADTGRIIGAIVGAGTASAVAAIAEHAERVGNFFRRLFR